VKKGRKVKEQKKEEEKRRRGEESRAEQDLDSR
jgi:hypothetical protein